MLPNPAEQQLLDGEGRNRTAEALEFADRIGLTRVAPDRCSILLAVQLLDTATAGWLDPIRVIHQIEALEGARVTTMKSATAFRGAHLSGLWHQHFLPNGVAAIARNVRNALSHYGIPSAVKRVREAQAAGEDRVFDHDDIARFTNEVVYENLDRREGEAKMTGEWLIFVPHDGRNYYLAIANHTDGAAGDEALRRQIDLVCVREFPFLRELLAHGGDAG